jgi:hypothetical protein
MAKDQPIENGKRAALLNEFQQVVDVAMSPLTTLYLFLKDGRDPVDPQDLAALLDGAIRAAKEDISAQLRKKAQEVIHA